MAGTTVELFEDLAARGHEPLLERVSGSMRFDIRDGRKTDHWTLVVNQGDLSVSRRNVDADCIVTADRPVFESIASGRTNAFAALLRGELVAHGDVPLMVAFQRVLPAPPRSRKRRSSR